MSVYNRTAQKAEQLAQDIEAQIVDTPGNAVSDADVIFLTVADDAIEIVANAIAHLNWQGKAIVHTSGVAGLNKTGRTRKIRCDDWQSASGISICRCRIGCRKSCWSNIRD